MKAEDFLHSKEIYQATCLTNKSTYYLKDLIILLYDYARIQIEKDRDDAAPKASEFGIGYNQIKIEQAIKNRPINLD